MIEVYKKKNLKTLLSNCTHDSQHTSQMMKQDQTTGSQNLQNTFQKRNLWNYLHYLSVSQHIITWIITYIPNLSFLAKELIWPVGSDPVDKKQMRGVRASLSSQVFSKFKMTGSVYFSCKEFAMYFLAWESVRSGHQDLEIKIYTKIKIHCLFLLPSPSLS